MEPGWIRARHWIGCVVVLALAACGDAGGPAGDLGPRDGTSVDGIDGTDVPIPEGAIPIVEGTLEAADETWIAAGAAWSRASSAATQMVSAVNGFVLCSVDNYGQSPRNERMDAARESVAILEDAGRDLEAAAEALSGAGVAGAVAALEDDFALAVRTVAVRRTLGELGGACVAEAQRVGAVLDGIDAMTIDNAGLDVVVESLRSGTLLAVAAGPVVAAAGTVTRASLPGGARGALSGESAGLSGTVVGDLGILSGWADPDGSAGPMPLVGQTPGVLLWRGDSWPAGPAQRAVTAVVTRPDPLDGMLATLSFPHPAAAVPDVRLLEPGEACWATDGGEATDPACVLAGSGLLQAGWYVDRDGGGGIVEAAGLSQAVGRRISTGLSGDEVVVTVPEDTEAPVPTVDSMSPTEGPVGTTVTLYGRNFGSDPARVVVRFECGQWAHVAPNAVSDTAVSATLPARPTLEASGPWCTYNPDRFVNCGMVVQVGARVAWGSYFKFTGLPLCPPSLLYSPDPEVLSVGDPLQVYGRGFSETLSANVAQFGGGATAAAFRFDRDVYEPDMARVYFLVPEGATTGDVRFKNTEGVDAWSAPSPVTIVPPTQPVLWPGAEAGGVHVPIVTMDLGGVADPVVWGHSHSWVLSHQNAGNLRAETWEKVGGHVKIDVQTPAGSYTVDGYALDEERLVVPVVTDAVGTLGRLSVGDTITLRMRGSELVNRFERVGAPLELVVASTVEIGATHQIAAWHVEPPSQPEQLAVAVGDVVVLEAGQPGDVVTTGGLTAAPVVFQDLAQAFTAWKDQAWIRGVRIPIDREGTWTVTYARNGESFVVSASKEGAYGFATWPAIGGGLPDVAAEGAHLACGGARIEVPPGALPRHQNGGGYLIWCQRQPLEVLGLPELSGAGLKTVIGFDPEPPALLKPITITVPVDVAARASTPELGVVDESTGLYAALPASLDGDRLRLILPAGTYAGPSEGPSVPSVESRAFTDLPWPLPNLPLNRLLGGIAAVSYGVSKGVLRDEERKIQVNFVVDPGATSYVTPDYAGEVLLAAQAAWDTLTGKGWPKPDGWLGGWVTLTITDMGPAAGTKGSTTKGVFGQPWVKINSRLSSGKQVATTTAHEMGHVFQRQVTTVFSLKWIDEAAAGWAAVASLGSDADLTEDLVAGAEFPTLSLPATFGTGFDVEQGYAAAALAIWMEDVSPGSVLRVYEQLRDSSLAWLDAWGTLAAATGRNPTQFVDEFAKAYWTQSLEVLAPLSIAQTIRDWIGWQGVTVGDLRPRMSSKRFDISTAAVQTPSLAGRDLVVRTSGLGVGQSAAIYRDTVTCGTPGPRPQVLRTILHDRPDELLGAHDATTRCYRVLVTNYAQSDDATVQVRIVAPQITGLSPSTGKNDGGYPVSIGGTGFGAAKGAGGVFLAGFPLTVTSWSDTSIQATMINAGTMQGDLDLKVLTAEQAWTNAATFTLYD